MREIVRLAIATLREGRRGSGSLIFDHVVPQLSRWSVMDALLVAIEQERPPGPVEGFRICAVWPSVSYPLSNQFPALC